MKKSLILLFLLTTFCVAPSFAQNKLADKEKLVSKFKEIKNESIPAIENQCEMFGKNDFDGTEISFDIVDSEIQDILILVNPFGCNFTVDESVEKKQITVNVKNVPWNLALQAILESQDLAVQIEDSGFRVVESFYESRTFFIAKRKTKPIDVPLYTEFIQLKHLRLEGRIPFCLEQKKSYYDSEEYKNSEKFFSLIKKELSKRGAVEFDCRSNTLIITDEEEKIKLIVDFVKNLDESVFTLEEILNDPNLEIK